MEQTEAKPTRFQSPLPLLIRLRNFVFGKEVPDMYTRISFVINLVVALLFFFWNIIGYVAISSRKMIWEFKGIPVESIISSRGEVLGFNGENFVERLSTLNGIGVICWGVVLFGLIQMYRKQPRYLYFVLGGILFYIGMHLFYLSFRFTIEDTTTFDKVALLVVLVNTVLHYFLLRNERSGGSINFFGEVEDDA